MKYLYQYNNVLIKVRRIFTIKKVSTFVALFLLIIALFSCSNKNETSQQWKESNIFETGNYKMIGIKGRVGFIYDKKNMPIVDGQQNKYMWDLWGEKNQLEKKFKVLGTHEGSKKDVIIVPETINNLQISPNNSADVSIPTSMEFKKSGMWKLDVLLDGKLFDTIYVKVNNK